jgi:hypothetical protein
MLTGGRILDPVSVGQHHVSMIVDKDGENKTDAKYSLGIFTVDLPSTIRQNSGVFRATRPRDGLKDAARRCPRMLRHLTTASADHRAPPPRPERRGFRRREFR